MDVELGVTGRSESQAYPKDRGNILARVQLYLRQHKSAIFAAIGFLGFVLIASSDLLQDSGLQNLDSSFGGARHDGYFSVADSIMSPNSFRFAAITDLDQLSKIGNKLAFKSILAPGTITYDKSSNKYSLEMDKIRTMETKHNEAGRGAEFSELTVFDNRLLTFDDRTGDIFEVMNTKDGLDSYVVPRYVVTEGEGDTDKGMKWEWSTVKDGLLYIGSMGKEYTKPDGSIVNVNNLWITIMDTHGDFYRKDWTPQFDFVRKTLGCQAPGYLVHEAIRWSPHMRKWVFMPRRISKEPYDDAKDEKRGSNKIVIVNEDFTEAQVVIVGMSEPSPGLHGFSSFAFVPGTNDRHALALRSVEEDCAGDDLNDCKQRSYIVVFDVMTGEVLLDEVKIEQDMKFEGIEFVDMFTKPN